MKIGVEFPEYTGLLTEQRPLEDEISALGGSTISLGRDHPGVERGRFFWMVRKLAQCVLSGLGKSKVLVNWTRAEKGGLGQSCCTSSGEDRRITFSSQSREGCGSSGDTTGSDSARGATTSNEQVRLEYEVLEDFGLKAVAVDLVINGGEVPPLTVGREEGPS